MSNLKDVALQIIGIGWYVLPLREKAKLPDGRLAPNGVNSSSNDRAKIEEWWTASPNANIGIDLGRSNLTVLDFDNGEPPADLNLPPTMTVKTGRGTHLYYLGASKQGDIVVDGKKIGDIKTTGGYVLAPCSVHPDGPVYTLTSVPGSNIAPTPTDAIAKLTPSRSRDVKEMVNEEGKLPKGSRYPSLISYLGKLLAAGTPHEQILTSGVEWARKWFDVPEGSFNTKMVTDEVQAFIDHGYPDGSPSRPMTLSGQQQPQAVQQAPPVDTSKWRDQFRQLGQMEDGPIIEVIKGVLQEGVCFLGALPSDGKTLVGLSMAKAICTGRPFLGLKGFSVPEPRQVIYLIPESKDRAFGKRVKAFHIPDSPLFLCRTTSMGPTMPLDDPYLMQAVRDSHAVVFLDTAARFMETTDENSAAQNQALVNDVFALIQAGAIAVVLVHHATKASANEPMTLENMLRGTGDFAAMCDQAYGVRKNRALYAGGAGPMEIELKNLKDREQIGQLTSVMLAASRKAPDNCMIPTVSIIDETGDFGVLDKKLVATREIDSLIELVKANPDITAKELAQEVPNNTERSIKYKLLKAGWHCTRGGTSGKSPWHQDVDGKCPFDTPDVTEVKPLKKTFDKTLPDALRFFKRLLTGPDGKPEHIYESDIYLEADAHGYPDSIVTKVKKRLGVVVENSDRDEEGDGLGEKMWTLREVDQVKPTKPTKPEKEPADHVAA